MITPAELKKMLDSREDIILLDARNPVDAEKIWIESNKRLAIPLNNLPEHYAEIPQDKKLIIIDVNGKRSSITASYLYGKGYKNMVRLGGGMAKWVLDGMPTAKSS